MAKRSTLSEINQRVAALADTLGEKLKQFASAGEMPAGHEEKAQVLGEKAATIRDKMPASEGTVWDDVADEIERDVHALEQDFDHWVRYLDKHFEEQGRKS